MSWCNDENDHKRQAREDFKRNGRYGYDNEKYSDRHYDDCAKAYADEFDRQRREDDRRKEERELEEEREHQAQIEAERARYEQEMEAYYWQQYVQEQIQAAYEHGQHEQPPDDDPQNFEQE